jgi:hypothetical protein
LVDNVKLLIIIKYISTFLYKMPARFRFLNNWIIFWIIQLCHSTNQSVLSIGKTENEWWS